MQNWNWIEWTLVLLGAYGGIYIIMIAPLYSLWKRWKPLKNLRIMREWVGEVNSVTPHTLDGIAYAYVSLIERYSIRKKEDGQIWNMIDMKINRTLEGKIIRAHNELVLFVENCGLSIPKINQNEY